MVVGVGTDLVDLARIDSALERHGDALLERLFTRRERELLATDVSRVERIAARFAAKEAALKALGVPSGLSWHELEAELRRRRPLGRSGDVYARRIDEA